jgi:hypothetical protein
MAKTSPVVRPTLSDKSLHLPYAQALRFIQLFFDSLYWGGIKKWVAELKPEEGEKKISYQMLIALKNETLVSQKTKGGKSPNIVRRVLLGLGYRTQVLQKKRTNGEVDYYMVFESQEVLNQFHQQLAEYEPSEPDSDEASGERPE